MDISSSEGVDKDGGDGSMSEAVGNCPANPLEMVVVIVSIDERDVLDRARQICSAESDVALSICNELSMLE